MTNRKKSHKTVPVEASPQTRLNEIRLRKAEIQLALEEEKLAKARASREEEMKATSPKAVDRDAIDQLQQIIYSVAERKGYDLEAFKDGELIKRK